MMHLEDSRKVASEGVKHANCVLDNLAVWAEQNIELGTEESVALLYTDKITALREDLEFCDRELARLGSYTEADQQTLRQHFQLSQDLTLFRLTLLAAIFLPLSFTNSLFGMNMTNAGEGPGSFSNVTNSTLEQITDTNFRSTAEALVTVISSSGNYNYDWAVFAGTAIGLIFILPLTLALGAIMRIMVVSVVRYAKYWRALTLVAAGVLLLAVVIISILGQFLFQYLAWGGYDEAWLYPLYLPADWGFYLRHFETARIAFGFLCTYWIINGLLLIMLLFLAYQSWSEERFFWTTSLLNTAVFFTVDMIRHSYPFPYMIFPWLCLGLFNSWARRRWSKIRFAS